MKLIKGVKVIKLKQIKDERGKIMHMLKRTDKHFLKFGEIYFSTAWPGAIKAWHIHTKMTLNNVVISGNAKLVIVDIRKNSKTKNMINEFFLGEDNYILVQIPPGLANGYKAYGDKQCILANCATHPHEKNEIMRMDPFNSKISYDWNLKNE
jgi:dTDP-4-dehydrorhamnose 3,5-epimerase